MSPVCSPARAGPACAALALCTALTAAGAPLQFRAVNQNLEQAKKLASSARYEEALEELAAAEPLPGNTNRQLAELYALRASCLLGLGPDGNPKAPERGRLAREALVLLLHVDPEGTALQSASEPARQLAAQLRTERPLLLHDRLVTVRTGRPIRVRARLSGPPAANAQLYVRYRLEPEGAAESQLQNPDDYVRVVLEPGAGDSYEAYLRPGVGGVPAQGEHVLRYYLEAVAESGALLDSNGTAAQPVRVMLSATQSEGAGVGGADAVVAALDEGGHVAHPPPPPPPPKPWYKRWEIVGPIGGAIVVGGVVAAVLLQPKPQAPSGSLATEHLP